MLCLCLQLLDLSAAFPRPRFLAFEQAWQEGLVVHWADGTPLVKRVQPSLARLAYEVSQEAHAARQVSNGGRVQG